MQGPAEKYYSGSQMQTASDKVILDVAPKIFSSIQKRQNSSKPIVRILEIGGGTANLTKAILPHILKTVVSNYEYTFTDISSAFFKNGKTAFENTKLKVQYKLLDIEKDPMSQGFIPHHYDMIFAGFVIHATKNVRKALDHIRNLLSDGGILFLVELTEPLRTINLLFGSLDQFWGFEDTDIRPFNCEMDVSNWRFVLNESAFSDIRTVSFYNSKCAVIGATAYGKTHPHKNETVRRTWVVFTITHDFTNNMLQLLVKLGKTVISVDFKNLNQPSNSAENDETFSNTIKNAINNADLEGVIYLWGLNESEEESYSAETFLTLCKLLVGKETPIKLMIYTSGVVAVEDFLVLPPNQSPLIAMARVVQNENPTLIVKCIDLDPSVKTINRAEEGLTEIYSADQEIVVVYRENRRLVPRMLPYKIPNTDLNIPTAGQYHMVLPTTNLISDLKFGQIVHVPVKDQEVEVRVKAYSLNFRDLFTVLKPDPMFEKITNVGLDFSGVVTATNSTDFKVGDAVCGLNFFGGSLASHIKIDSDMLFPMPTFLTFEEASAICLTAVTAYVCLNEATKIQKGEIVLIHTASGGVGLCAVQFAKYKECKIIATAGSKKKRRYLRNLGIEHVFSSRDTTYENRIHEILNGEGVDVVLNSLTSTGFKEATLAVCKSGARFIEMSKVNTWSNAEVAAMRPDIIYGIVDISDPTKRQAKDILEEVMELVRNYTFKPLPYIRYDLSQIREALTYLQKAKHIGKIVCVMPEPNSDGAKLFKSPLFNDRSTYLITGGLGGIGFEIAKWMSENGAKYIVLVNRNISVHNRDAELEKLSAKGIQIDLKQCDISKFLDCKTLIKSIETDVKLPPLRGIMHAAGVLADALYENQTWEKYEQVFNPKVKGGWNLHQLTIDYMLEFFVMFSSGAATLGPVSQSNHAAANYYLDNLAHYRNSLGLPATTINWGQWGQVGVAANIKVVGLQPFTVLQGVSALEKIMRSNLQQVTVVEADLALFRKYLQSTKTYLEEIKTADSSVQLNKKLDADKFWKEYDAADSRSKRYEIVKESLKRVIRFTTKLDDDEEIDEDANFQDLGLDSLMMIEMKNGLQTAIGSRVKITVSSVRDSKTTRQLANKLVDLISGEELPPPPTKEELVVLIKEDSILPEEIDAKHSNEKVCSTREIKTVLITGVTGNFGPYILRYLSQMTQIEKIYCLLRDTRIVSPKDRLKILLHEKKLLKEINLDKVECVSGDVVKPCFGLSEDLHGDIAKNVDAIFHLSVKSSYDEFYYRTNKVHHSRVINVTGIKNILQLACKSKLKQVYYPSTIASVTTVDKNDKFWEDWPRESEFDNQVNSSYSVSKYICDRLVAQAVQRGIPCKAFRFPFMGGDSVQKGNIAILGYSLVLRHMFYMLVGMMPARNMPIMIIPVDVCADISLRIFFNSEAPFEIYNVTNPSVEDELLLVDVAPKFGYNVEIVEEKQFFEKLHNIQLEGSNEMFEASKLVTSRENDISSADEYLPQVYTTWLTGIKDVFLSQKLLKFIPEYPSCLENSWDLLIKDLQYAKDAGYFDRIGLK